MSTSALFGCSFYPFRNSAKDLTFFAGKAVAMNRQLAEQAVMAEQQQLDEAPTVITASSTSMHLSPPSNSKLAKRRQSLLKTGPVSASELCQLLAPLVITSSA